LFIYEKPKAMKTDNQIYFFIFLLIGMIFSDINVTAQETKGESELDKKVRAFLNSRANSWRDMNVPVSDGQLLYDIIVKNKYKSAVEIGTSTGHSSIWIAWALSKTGGKLITIEIDEDRYKEALANFEKAGVAQFIDARLADAHELVPKLNGPIDFVFSDADKDWYTNYFKALDPKLAVGGCFTAHNVGMAGVREYYEYISKLPYYKTTVDNHGGGMAISYKTAEK
jgi:predicted O-methyltransferase YrrM